MLFEQQGWRSEIGPLDTAIESATYAAMDIRPWLLLWLETNGSFVRLWPRCSLTLGSIVIEAEHGAAALASIKDSRAKVHASGKQPGQLSQALRQSGPL